MTTALSRINSFRADPMGRIGSGVMLLFAVYAAYRFYVTGMIFFALLIVRDLAASWFLLSRNLRVKSEGNKFYIIIAYLSSAFPFFYLGAENSFSNARLISSILAIVGFTISTIALFDLGSSFGVAPANRGVVKTGIYKYLKHPMYLGYVISECGFVFLNPSNFIFFVTSSFLYLKRIKIENLNLKN